MRSRSNHSIVPSEVSPELVRQLGELVHNSEPPALVGANGVRIELPSAINSLLAFVVDSMKREEALVLMPETAPLTTQAAANLLGMSRPYLLRLLDANTIPSHRIGTHRRILLSDLRAYKSIRDAERLNRLDGLADAIDEAGVYWNS